VDAEHHRYHLIVSLCERLHKSLAPVLEANSSSNESTLLELCLSSEGFHRVFRELEAEVKRCLGVVGNSQQPLA
jgi:hypothetical protein